MSCWYIPLRILHFLFYFCPLYKSICFLIMLQSIITTSGLTDGLADGKEDEWPTIKLARLLGRHEPSPPPTKELHGSTDVL